MDYLYWAFSLAAGVVGFLIGLGVGGLLTVLRIDRYNAAAYRAADSDDE